MSKKFFFTKSIENVRKRMAKRPATCKAHENHSVR